MLSVFSQSSDSICPECESTAPAVALSYSCRGPMTPRPLLSEKALTQQISAPLDPDVKWAVFTPVTSGRRLAGAEPSRGVCQGARQPGSGDDKKVSFRREMKQVLLKFPLPRYVFAAFMFKTQHATSKRRDIYTQQQHQDLRLLVA